MNYKKKISWLLLLGIIFTLFSGCSGKEKVEEVLKIPVEVYEVKKDTLTREITISGIAEPEVSSMVIPEIAGAKKVIGVPVKVGDSVRQGTVLAFLDSQSTALNYEVAEASYLDAEKNYERNKALFEAGAISKSQFEQVEMGFLQAKNSFEMRKIELSSYSVKSPIDGVVSSVNVTVGSLASPQSPVAVISKINSLLIKSSVNEKEVNNLKVGQEVNVTVPNLGNKVFPGVIKNIAPTMDMQIRAFPVEIKINNSNLEIQSGTFAKAVIEVEKREGVVVVPSEAVIIRGGQAKVFVVREEKAESVVVVIGLNNSKSTEIISGLNQGDQVITRGNDNVIVGDLVRIVQPMERQIENAKEEAASQ